jgi:preprotein translocase subunit SecG
VVVVVVIIVVVVVVVVVLLARLMARGASRDRGLAHCVASSAVIHRDAAAADGGRDGGGS